MAHQIGIFISHSWKYDDHYKTLSDWIFGGKWNVNHVPLQFYDYSIPKDNPIHSAPNSRALQDAIYAEIQKSHIIVIPMGLYSTYSQWIQKEIDGARAYRRPILAVNLWGQERKSSVVAEASNEMVGWNKQSVINGIWKLYRNHYNG